MSKCPVCGSEMERKIWDVTASDDGQIELVYLDKCPHQNSHPGIVEQLKSRIAALEAELAKLKEDNKLLRYYAAVGYGLEEEMYRHNGIGLMRTKDLKLALVGFNFRGIIGTGEDMRQVMQDARIWPDAETLVEAGLLPKEETK